MAPKRRVGGRARSSSSSGIFFSADDQCEVQGNSTLSSSCGNSSNGNGQGSLGLVYGSDGNGAVLNLAGSSGPSVGASSLVTDANSGLSGGINNTESYTRLPASPMSFSSNIRSVSGSPIMDGSFVVQQNQEPNSQQSHQSQQHQGPSHLGQVQPSNNRFPSSFTQDPTFNSQLQKKPRLDIKQEDVSRQHLLQPFLPRQDSLHLQNAHIHPHPHPQVQALIQQQRLQRQQEILQSMSQQQRAQLLEQHQLQLRHQFQQQGLQSSPVMKQSFDSGVCSRMLMQYLKHQRQRPVENTLDHWKDIVAKYYAPQAKQRWCFSLYNNNVGHHSPGVSPQATLDASHCNICRSKPSKGYVATFESLPRLYDMKYANGLVDELLSLDLPREVRSPSGEMMLECAKAVQESVYEKSRVVHEGKLRIIFTSDLKILSWEFCAHRHEEFLPRRLVAPQVNHLLEIVKKCQSTISEKPNAVSHQDLLANCNMFVTAGTQLVRSLDLQSINDLGFNKRYARCLQLSEVANCMKDLMDFSENKKFGPMDALKEFTRHGGNVATSQPQNMQKMYNMLGAGRANQTIQNNCDEVNEFVQSPYAPANYRNMLAARRIPMNSNHGAVVPPVNSCNPNQHPSPYNHHQPPPPPPLQQSSNNSNGLLMQNNTQDRRQHNQTSQEIANGESGCGGGGQQRQYVDDNQNGNGLVGWRDGTETGMENDNSNPVGNISAAKNSLKTDSNHCLNNGFNQEPVESVPSDLPVETVSDKHGFESTMEEEEEDYLNYDIDDYIDFDLIDQS